MRAKLLIIKSQCAKSINIYHGCVFFPRKVCSTMGKCVRMSMKGRERESEREWGVKKRESERESK